MCFSLVLRLQVINGHNVEFPAAQLRSQTDVLTVTANRLRQVARFNRDIHGVLVFVNHNRCHVSRSHRVDHELRWVVVPQHDIDTFAAQLGRDRLNTRTAHTNTSTDWVDTFVVGLNSDFGTRTRIASSSFDFDNFFTDFWHFNAEQFDQHFRLRTGDEELRTARFRTYGVQNTADTVAWTEVFTRQHVFTQDNRFSVVAKVQRDVVAVNFLNHAGDDLTFMLTELVYNHCAFSFTYFLYDNLFCSLGRNTVEGHRFDLIFNVFAHVQAFVFEACRFEGDFFSRLGHFFDNNPTTEGVEITATTVNFNANVDFLFVFFLRCCSQRTFQRFKNFLAWQ